MSKAILETTQGTIEFELFDDVAPKTCENFTTHIKNGYYNGIIFHRIIEEFMIQGGDPTGSGMGGESIWGKPFEDECARDLTFDKPGLLAMANAGPGTNGSQFFITHVPTPHLDGMHTVFGAVEGDADQKVVDSIVQGDTIESITIQGNVGSLFKKVKPRLDEWNKTLNKNFPKLPKA